MDGLIIGPIPNGACAYNHAAMTRKRDAYANHACAITGTRIMSRHFNAPHPDRGKSTYSKRQKSVISDRYGRFDNGRQISSDKIAGRSIWYPREEKVNA